MKKQFISVNKTVLCLLLALSIGYSQSSNEISSKLNPGNAQLSNLFNDNPIFITATTGAACQVVECNNNLLFTGTGSTVRIYDVGPGKLPPYEMIFEHRYRSKINDLQLNKNFLYVSANHDGIAKWDIANPHNPQLMTEYIPDNFDEAAFEISFSGDTLFVTFAKKVAVFQDKGNYFEKLTEFGNISGRGFISGGALKNNYYAYVVGLGGSEDGVYIYDAHNFSFLSFIPQTFADPEDVMFGKNNDLLHVLGGTQSTTNPFDARGYFYSLDLTNINAPQIVFQDTIKGLTGLAIANVINGVNINDTLYVATTAGLKPDQTIPDVTYVFVYDATETNNVHLISYLPAGLWHFDVAKFKKRLYIASEWYGVKTLNISDLMNPIDLGNTLTGGWNTGGDKFNDYLLVANEGNGFKKYDISDIKNPVLIGENQDGTFCHLTKFSSDGNYIFGIYSTGANFKVFDAHSLAKVDSINSSIGNGEMLVWQDRVYLNYKPIIGKQKLNVIDVSNPHSVKIENSVEMNVNDMFIENGKLYVTNNDGIFVFDISNHNFQQIASENLGLFNAAKALTVFQDTIYSYIAGLGTNKLMRYFLKLNGNQYSLIEDGSFDLEYGEPQKMAADRFGLYLAYTKYGLFAYDKKTITQTGYYRTGLDYKGYSDIYGVVDLYCKDDYIFLVEYLAQTTILTNKNGLTSVEYQQPKENIPIEYSLYPNPISANSVLKCYLAKDSQLTIKIYNILGQEMLTLADQPIRAGEHSFNLNRLTLSNGVYFIRLKTNTISKTIKIMVLN